MVDGKGGSSEPHEPATDLCSFARVCTALAYVKLRHNTNYVPKTKVGGHDPVI